MKCTQQLVSSQASLATKAAQNKAAAREQEAEAEADRMDTAESKEVAAVDAAGLEAREAARKVPDRLSCCVTLMLCDCGHL